MSKLKLSKGENEIFKDFEAGDSMSVLTSRRKKSTQATADETFKKDKSINMRVSSRDQDSLQRRAPEEGILCQTLVTSVLHQYVSGSLKDVAAYKRMQPTQITHS